ncbi:MAG: hypothetical protein AAGL10_06300 [Pseudomonadota bacterium]
MSRATVRFDRRRLGQKHPLWWMVSFVAGALIAIFIVPIGSDWAKTAWNSDWIFYCISVSLLFTSLVLLWLGIAYGKDIFDLSREIKLADENRNERFERFEHVEEAVADGTLRYGFVPFFPTCVPQSHTVLGAKGPGMQLLQKVFKADLPSPSRERNWTQVLDDLERKDGQHRIDICATPLYDFKERRARVDFTAPIFYADIGLFTSKSNKRVPEKLLQNARKSTFLEVKQAIQASDKKLRLSGVKDELQERMCLRHFAGKSMKGKPELRFREGDFKISEALECLNVDAGDPNYSDLLFCERAQAADSGRDDIVNLLKPGQLLFPVCFAVRKGEDTLRKYINIRMMSIEGTELPDDFDPTADHGDTDSLSGIMRVLLEAVSTVELSIADFKKYYRRHYILPTKGDGEQANVVEGRFGR